MKRQRFAPHGRLALDPRAFGLVHDVPEVKPAELDEQRAAAVIRIRGPLMHHRDFWFDSYESIRERFAMAVELAPRVIVLDIDSPGGVVSGAFDTARRLRSMADAAGIPLAAYVGGQAASAAYAIASAARYIGVSESAWLGSIGVIDTLVDATEQNRAMGLAVELVTSGERKADGNPNASISDGARAAAQGRVDELARMFFELVDDHGWGESAARLEGMQAALVHGADAVRLGLASEVATLEQTIAVAADAVVRCAERTDETMAKSAMDEAEEMLRKAAESDDEEEAKRARAALAALGCGDDEEAESDDDDEAKASDDEAMDDDDDEEAKAMDDDDEEAKAKASAAPSASATEVALRALSEVHELKAERAAEKREAERAKLLASRPDFAPELVEVLRTAPLAMVRKTCSTLKRGPARAERVAEAATATATVRGEEQGNGFASRLPPERKAALDIAMGLTEMTSQTVHTPNRMSFGVRRPVTGKDK